MDATRKLQSVRHSSERRAIGRMPLQGIARIRAGHLAPTEHFGVVENISADGAFLLSDKCVPVGRQVQIVVNLRSRSASARLSFIGYVVRCVDFEQCFGLAVAFKDSVLQVRSPEYASWSLRVAA